MTNFLYRFRRFSDLKGDDSKGRESELLGHYIFFASPEKLNDPLEGYREIIWKGDLVVWRNLFAHYFLCLAKRHLQYCLIENIEDHPLSVSHSYQDEPIEISSKIKELSKTFLRNENIMQHLQILSFGERIVKRDELTLHLSMVHNYALHVMSQHFAELGLVRKGVGIHVAPIPELLRGSQLILDYYHSLTDSELMSISDSDEHSPLEYIESRSLKNNYEIWREEENYAWMALSISFPEDYVSLLKTLCHNDWYTACFMESCTNSAIWGTYGSEHTGACLKFNVGDDERESIRLQMSEAFLASPGRDIRNFHFQKVTYDGYSPDLDFFTSLGSLSAPRVISEWLVDPELGRSSCYENIFFDQEKWRKEYHAQNERSITSKTSDWAGEGEKRLLLQSIRDLTASNSRKLKYDFKDLDSIIFGVNMPSKHKFELIQMIEKLCRTYSRERFVFNQAFFMSDKKVGYRPIYTVELDKIK